MMNKLNANIHTIVHLGAGVGRDLQKLMVKKPNRVVLVEADPQRFARLEEASTPYDNVELFCVAVGEREESAKLNLFSLAEVNSICTPQGLLDIFPGLQLVEVVDVAAAPASQIISQVNLDESENNALIVDTPGVEFKVLQDLHGAKQLQLFKYLFLNCGRVPLYQDGASGFTIVDWLKDEGFAVEEFEEGYDYDRPSWLLRRNDLLLHHKELSMRFEELEKQSVKTKMRLQEEETKTKELTELCDKQARTIEDLALENKRIKHILEEHEQTIDGKIKEEAELRAQLEEKYNQIRILTQNHSEESRKLGELKERLEHQEIKNENLETTIKELKDREKNLASELEKEIGKYSQQIESLKEEKEKIQKQAESEKEKALATAQQLQEEQDYRQQIIDQEVLKAEAQLELVKDILIRDKAF